MFKKIYFLFSFQISEKRRIFECANRTSIVQIVKTFVLSKVFIILLTKRKKNLAKYFLGVFMFAAFLLYFSHAIFFHEEKYLYLYIDPIYTFSSLLVYPLYFVYIKLLSIDASFKKENWILFFPAFVIGGLTFLNYLLMDDMERLNYIDTYFFNTNHILKNTFLQKIQRIIYTIGRLIFTIQVFYFLYKGSKLIQIYNKRIANFYSNTANKTINWVKLLLLSFVITSVMSVIFNIIGKHYFLNSPLLLLIPSTIFSLLLFFIGYEGFMQNHTVINLINDEKEEPIISHANTNQEILKEKLIACFENDKIYHNSELKITDVSRLLSTNRTYISHLINTDFECSFNDFVNTYRINEAKKTLKLNSSTKYTLEYIAESVGFGSLHTFIRVFKKMVGVTPGTYKNNSD